MVSGCHVAHTQHADVLLARAVLLVPLSRFPPEKIKPLGNGQFPRCLSAALFSNSTYDAKFLCNPLGKVLFLLYLVSAAVLFAIPLVAVLRRYTVLSKILLEVAASYAAAHSAQTTAESQGAAARSDTAEPGLMWVILRSVFAFSFCFFIGSLMANKPT